MGHAKDILILVSKLHKLGALLPFQAGTDLLVFVIWLPLRLAPLMGLSRFPETRIRFRMTTSRDIRSKRVIASTGI